MWKRIRLIWNDFLNLFFPRLCLTCSKPLIEGEQQICLYCLCDLPTAKIGKGKENPVFRICAGNKYVKECAAAYLFERDGKVQKIIHSFKYYDNKELAYLMGKVTAKRMQEEGLYESVDLIIPVPLHKKKEKKRGYNQSEWIAKGFSEVYNLPIDIISLIRLRNSDTQTNKDIYERHLNAIGLFKVIDQQALTNKHILLIDDVITAGATIQACIDALADIPGLQISIFSLSVAG